MLKFIPYTIRTILLVLTMMAWSSTDAPAADVPAKYIGKFQCPAKYPGSFLDIGRQECWKCPAATPKRTIFPVTQAWACEKPAREVFRRAKGPRNPTGFFRTDCQKGWFLDVFKGKCYSCTGYNRSLHAVTHPRACSIVVPLKKSRATLMGNVGCGDGFQHFFSGNCYTCPVGSYRNANTGNDPSKIGACTICGGLNGKPCPITTLRKSCDPGLVEHLLQGKCIIDNSHEGKIYRKALAKAEELAPQLGAMILNANTLSKDQKLVNGLNAKSPNTAGTAQQTTGANPCALNAFNTWSLGGTVHAGFILGGTLETGMAVDIRERARTGAIAQNNAFWYGGGSWDISLGAGVSAGINYGCWTAENNAILGKFEGAVFDPLGMAQISKAINIKDFATIKDTFKKGGISIDLGVWFEQGTGDFLGFTLTPAYGRGIGAGGYTKGETLQFP